MAEVGRWKPYTQRQGQLLPAFVEDALDPGDPVFFISDAVEQMELTAVEQRYAVLGEHAYDPRLLLKLWLYAATQGVHSGRELARRVRRDLAFRFLVGDGAVPDFRTINRFRVRHRADFAAVLLEPRHQKSLADPDANMMRVGNDAALTYASNAQAATSEDGVIVGVGLTTTVPDTPQALPMVAAVTATTGAAPGCALFDKGYLSEANLATLRAQGQRCLIAVGREGKGARWPQGVETQRMHRLLRFLWARQIGRAHV